MKKLLFSIVFISSQIVSSYAQTGCTSGDYKNGYGVYKFANGNYYEGNFVNGTYDGKGTFYFASGDKYEGSFKNGLRNGNGTFTFANGNKYIGDNVNDKFEGDGSFIFANGDEYAGGFAAGKRNGFGVFYYADGSEKIGFWGNDNYLGHTDTNNPKPVIDRCEAMKTIAKDIPNYFGSITGAEAWDQYSELVADSKVVVPPAKYGIVYDDFLGVSCEFVLIEDKDKNKVEDLYNEFKSQIPTCLNLGWNSWEKDSVDADNNIINKYFRYSERKSDADTRLTQWSEVELRMGQSTDDLEKYYWTDLYFVFHPAY